VAAASAGLREHFPRVQERRLLREVSPPLTRSQVELMEIDTVASTGTPGFGELGISPHAIEEVLPEILRDH
jgi:hypothetical protein